MDLLRELLNEAPTSNKKDAPPPRNFVAKHSTNMSGAGEHEVKTKFSRKKRLRDKQQLKKDLNDRDY